MSGSNNSMRINSAFLAISCLSIWCSIWDDLFLTWYCHFKWQFHGVFWRNFLWISTTNTFKLANSESLPTSVLLTYSILSSNVRLNTTNLDITYNTFVLCLYISYAVKKHEFVSFYKQQQFFFKGIIHRLCCRKVPPVERFQNSCGAQRRGGANLLTRWLKYKWPVFADF